jgi:translation initiation factor IF-2
LHDQKIYIDEMVDGDIEDDSTLNLILKGPDFGTVESIQILIKRVIEEHRDEDLDVRIIECGVGDISPKDIKEAKTHNATVLTLNVEHSSPEVGRLARSLGIKTHQHRIIYALLDDFKAIMVQLRDRARNTDKLAGSGVIK